MLDIPILRQEPAMCGPTALAAALAYWGWDLAIDDVARAASATSRGTNHGGLVAAAKSFGATVIERSNATIDELRVSAIDTPVIVGWWTGDDAFDPSWSIAEREARDGGHYAVVRGVDDTYVYLMDPDRGNTRMRREDFVAVWYDTDEDDYHFVAAWLLAVRRA